MSEATVFVFPGQGSQVVGMGKDAFGSNNEARRLFLHANEVLGFDLAKLMFEGPIEELTQTQNAQPAILTHSVVMAHLLEDKGITATHVAGHSLGEFSALVVAGALAFEDAVKLVRFRGQFMQAAVPLGEGTMAAILGLDDSAVEVVCKQTSKQGASFFVEVANYNGPGQVVISGKTQGVFKAMEDCKVAGAKRAMELKVSAPFHCALLEPAALKLNEKLTSVTISPLSRPYFANVDAKLKTDHEGIVQRLTDQVTKPVRWTQIMENIKALGPKRVLEVGPGKVITGLMKKIDQNCLSVSDLEALSQFS